MTKEQFNHFMAKEINNYSEKATPVYDLADWIKSRTVILELVKNVDSLVEIYNMENQE